MRYLITLLIFVPFVSCSVDDDNSNSDNNLNGIWYFTDWKEVPGWDENMEEENNFFNVLSSCDLNSYLIINGNNAELFSYSDICTNECVIEYLSDYSLTINSSTIGVTVDSFNNNCLSDFNENSIAYEVELYHGSYKYEILENNLKLMFNNEDGQVWTDVITLERD